MPKRDPRDRDIYNRGPNSFQVKIRRNGISYSRTFSTRTEARKQRDIQYGRITGHEYVDRTREQRTTLRDLILRYLEEETPKKKGARQERSRLNLWLREEIATYSTVAITSADISSWVQRQEVSGAAPSTIANKATTLSAVFKHAASAWDYNIQNPCKGVRLPKPRKARFATLTADQERILLQSCARGWKTGRWLPLVVKLALTTGARQGELRYLRWDGVHSTHVHLHDTKNNTDRDVPLTSEAADVIEEIRTILPQRLDGWVFGDPEQPAECGGFTEHMVQNAFRAAEKSVRSRLDQHYTFHDLRHVALTRLADYHDNVIDLSETSGHKTLGVLKRYINRTPEEKAARLREREAEVKSGRRARA